MTKKLYRLRHGKILGGVAAGVAEYFQVDVVLVRLIWVLVALAGGSGLLAYIIAWIIIPEEPALQEGKSETSCENDVPGDETKPNTAMAKTSPRTMFGLILVVLGSVILANRLFSFPWHIWNGLLNRWWPLGIVAIGVFIIWQAVRGGDK